MPDSLPPERDEPLTYRVEVTRNLARLAAIAPQWDALAAQALEPNPSYESWMLLPAMRALGDPPVVECVLVWAQNGSGAAAARLVGLFPFQRCRSIHGLPARMLGSWCHSSFLLGSPLLRADCAGACLRTLLDWVGDDRTPAVEFAYLPEDGAFYGLLAQGLREHRWTATATKTFTRALLRKADSAERYLEKALSKSDRESLRRRERRLREAGAVAHVAMSPDDDVGRWLGDLLRLESSGWKGECGGAFACDEGQHRFAIDALTAAHARQRLRIVGVDLDGQPISREAMLIAGVSSYSYRTAYDEAYAKYGPGIIMAIDAVRAFHELPGVDWMDSITAPDNQKLNRLWRHRRTIHSVVVGTRAWGEIWVRLLPHLRRAKQILRKAA